MDGESKNAYNQRVMNKTREIMKCKHMTRQNLERRRLKKEFLNNKKRERKITNNNIMMTSTMKIIIGHIWKNIMKSFPNAKMTNSSFMHCNCLWDASVKMTSYLGEC